MRTAPLRRPLGAGTFGMLMLAMPALLLSSVLAGLVLEYYCVLCHNLL